MHKASLEVKRDNFSEKPLVSVIIPVYDSQEFIAEAIESVIRQTYQNWEMIIVDDKSTDDSVKIAKSYVEKDSRIKVFELDSNSGRPAVPRNYGLKHSQGRYVAFLDSDDVWLPSKLAKQMCHFQGKGIVGVGSQELWIKGPLAARKYFSGHNGYTDYQYRDILSFNYISSSSVVAPRDILVDLGGFDECEDFLYIEDWELWLRMAQRGKFRVLQDPLLFYRIRPDKKLEAAKASKRQFCVIEKHLRLGNIAEDDLKDINANINFLIGLNLIRLEDPENREYFTKALKDTSEFKLKVKIFGWYLLSLLPLKFLKVLRFLFFRFKALGYKRLKNSNCS